jgi:16S rRNA processing protein RimM
MGRVAGSYGVRGWIKVVPYGVEVEALAAHPMWRLGGKAHVLEEARPHSGKLLAKLAGIETREQARALKGATVALPRGALAEPMEGQYYWADLIGLEVVGPGGEPFGVVKQLFSNGAHDVMEVAGARTRLLPWVSEVIRRVDLKEKRIEVDWQADW